MGTSASGILTSSYTKESPSTSTCSHSQGEIVISLVWEEVWVLVLKGPKVAGIENQ